MIGNQDQQGFTVLELLVVLAIVAILTVTALPPFITYLQTSRLTSATQNIYYTLEYARTQAIKTNTTIYVSFVTGSTWCYGINSGSTCTCNVANSCTLGSIQAPASGQLTLSATGLTSNSIHFEPNHGASLASSKITLTNGQGTTMSVEIASAGSLLVCSPTVSGYQTC